ncbi:MAG TPA: alpha-galactosidase [Thermoanaerobacterales bacterium]|nr:alpha-galactosidase [Thermoanaerobacterales bacterium]
MSNSSEFTALNLKKVGKVILLSVLIWSFFLGTSYGAGQLSLSTPYPGISAQPGSSVTFPLTVSGTGFVDLEVTATPSGWTAGIFGDGMKIHRVYVPTNDSAEAELRVQIPSEAKSGDYSLSVEASRSGRAKLLLNIRIDADASGSDKIEVQYPSLSGPDTATFSFRGTLYNNSGRARFYSLGANAPEGWQISFKPAYQNNQITSLSLEPGKSQDLDITVQPPKGVKAGKNTITTAAVHGSEVAKADLEVVISGTYRLELSTPTGRLNADLTAGRKGSLTLELENKGSADLQTINLSASAPPGWAVTFEPEKIERIKSGEKKQITAFITPDGKAIAGDYVLSINASASETSENADIRVTVHTSTRWGLVGAFIIVGVISWVAWTFKKYGRR